MNLYHHGKVSLPMIRKGQDFYRSYNGFTLIRTYHSWDFSGPDVHGPTKSQALGGIVSDQDLVIYDKVTQEYRDHVKAHQVASPIIRTFREQPAAEGKNRSFVSEDGYIIQQVPARDPAYEGEFEYIRTSPDGSEAARSSFVFADALLDDTCESIRYLQDKRKGLIKIGLGHLTKASVITATLPNQDTGTYTVDSVVNNAPDSWVIKCVEKKSDGYFKGEAETFNVSYVESIVTRADGPIPFCNKRTHASKDVFKELGGYEYYRCLLNSVKEKIRVKKNERLFLAGDAGNSGIRSLILDLPDSVTKGRSYDTGSLIKRLVAMGLARPVMENIYGRSRFIEGYLVKHKEASAFIKKYPQHCLASRDLSQALENVYQADAMEGFYGTMDSLELA